LVVMMVTTFTAVATPHALILTVSHDLLFRQPPSCAAAQAPPSPFIQVLFVPVLFVQILFVQVLPASASFRHSGWKPPVGAFMQLSR
jgi:hypothetical protein